MWMEVAGNAYERLKAALALATGAGTIGFNGRAGADVEAAIKASAAQIANVAALANLAGDADGQVGWLLGRNANGDGAAGPLIWHAGDATTADDATVFGTTAAGRWKRPMKHFIDAEWLNWDTAAGADNAPVWAKLLTIMNKATENGIGRHIWARLPAGYFRLAATTSVQLADNQNNFEIRGHGSRNTEFLCDFTNADVLQIPGANITLGGFTLTASAARTAGASGHGVALIGAAQPPTTTQANVRLIDIQAKGHAGNGFDCDSPELVLGAYLLADSCGGRGFYLHSTAANAIGINNCFALSRAQNCQDEGWRNDAFPISTTLLQCEALSNCQNGVASAQISDFSSRGMVAINPDVETSLTTYASDGWVGKGAQAIVMGLNAYQMRKAIYCNGQIDSLFITPFLSTGNGTTSRTVHLAGTSTGNVVLSARAGGGVPGAVQDDTSNANGEAGKNLVWQDGTLYGGRAEPNVVSANVTGTYNPDHTQASEFHLTLTGATGISTVTSAGERHAGDTLRLWIIQDGTGGHALTFGTTYNAPGWSDSGNVAGAVAMIEFEWISESGKWEQRAVRAYS